MWGPREHGEHVGLTSPREWEMPCQSGGVGAGPPCWRPDKATVFQLDSDSTNLRRLVQQKSDDIYRNIPRVIPEWGERGCKIMGHIFFLYLHIL